MLLNQQVIELTSPVTLLWLRCGQINGALIERAGFSSEEITKFSSFKFESRKIQFAVVRALLNAYFQQKVNVEYLPNGAPYLAGLKRFLSISHSGETVAVVISEIPVGLDVECNVEKPIRVLKKYANANECVCFVGDEKVQAMKLWSVKEAVFKVFREDLPFKDIQVAGKEDNLIVTARHKGKSNSLQVFHGQIEDCVLSVAQ